MKYRFVYELPLLVLIFIVVYSLYVLIPPHLAASWPVAAAFLNRYHLTAMVNQTIEPYVPLTSPEQLTSKINQYRQAQALPPLTSDAAICQTAIQGNDISEKDIFSSCRDCSHATVISISKYAQPNMILARLLEESTTQAAIIDPNASILCISDRGDNLSLLFARQKEISQVTPKPAAIVKRTLSPAPTSSPTSFSESELWSALTIYRQAQGKPNLEQDEKLCQYARKRVNDQITMMASTKKADYPNQEKYPLDAHQGFAQDADSGYAFDVTGVNHLAENLAYYPGAQAAIHIIEWGWDTSTEGHRETQLSTEFTKACISGGSGFYVAIFGN